MCSLVTKTIVKKAIKILGELTSIIAKKKKVTVKKEEYLDNIDRHMKQFQQNFVFSGRDSDIASNEARQALSYLLNSYGFFHWTLVNDLKKFKDKLNLTLNVNVINNVTLNQININSGFQNINMVGQNQ